MCACEKAKKNKRVDDYIIQEERQKSVYGESKTNTIRTILHTIGNKKKEKKKHAQHDLVKKGVTNV